MERYHKARAELVAGNLIAFDEVTSVVMIRQWFRHNPPMNEKHFIGIERTLERLPSETIAQEVKAAAEQVWNTKQTERAAKGKASPQLMRTALMRGG
jgi:hypothetical protein